MLFRSGLVVFVVYSADVEEDVKAFGFRVPKP